MWGRVSVSISSISTSICDDGARADGEQRLGTGAEYGERRQGEAAGCTWSGGSQPQSQHAARSTQHRHQTIHTLRARLLGLMPFLSRLSARSIRPPSGGDGEAAESTLPPDESAHCTGILLRSPHSH